MSELEGLFNDIDQYLAQPQTGGFRFATNKLTCDVPATVTHERAIVVTRGGQELGHISAVYDFSSMPAEHHRLCISMIQHSRNIHLPDSRSEQRVKKRAWWEIF